MRIDLPGINGSLGECAVCGKSFAMEVILGKRIETVRMTGLDAQLPVHGKCCDEVIAISEAHRGEPDCWTFLPEGPLRQEFAKAATQRTSPERDGGGG